MVFSLRVWPARYVDDDAMAALRALLVDGHAQIDELALIPFATLDAFTPLPEVQARRDILARRFDELRQDGYAVGVNDVCLGHMADSSSWKAGAPAGVMVGHDGTPAPGTLGLASDEAMAYLAERYRLIAEAGPDFIWVDDDARVQQHPPAFWPDFSDESLARFNARHRAGFDRESLLEMLNRPSGDIWRREWTRHLDELLRDALSTIRDAVRGVDPRIELGLMTSGLRFNSYAGADLAGWVSALGATRARPGGGFYTDHRPLDLFTKLADCAEQAALLRPHVRTLDYEFETFPQQRHLKSVRMATTECSLLVANGMDGVTAHILKPEAGSLAEYDDWLRALGTESAAWRRMTEIAGERPVRGVRAVSSPHWFEQRARPTGEPWIPDAGSRTRFVARDSWKTQAALLPLGIPHAWQQHDASVLVLSAELVDGHSRAELESILAGPVVLDHGALARLEQLGHGDATGVRIARWFDNGVLERSTAHPVNGDFAGEERDARLGVFGVADAVLLEPLADAEVETLADVVTYDGQVLGPCLTLHRNAAGGTVTVLGYSPWTFLDSTAKTQQLLDLFDVLGTEPLPARVSRRCVVPTIRRGTRDDGFLLHLVNAGLDVATDIEVRIERTERPVRELFPDGYDRAFGGTVRHEGSFTWLGLDRIDPWGYRVLFASSDTP